MIHIDDLVEINQGDNNWTGPYKVVDWGLRSDFINNGRTEVLYLQPPIKHTDPDFIDYPIHLLHAHRAERRSDGLLAFRYPRALCRLVLAKQNGGSARNSLESELQRYDK